MNTNTIKISKNMATRFGTCIGDAITAYRNPISMAITAYRNPISMNGDTDRDVCLRVVGFTEPTELQVVPMWIPVVHTTEQIHDDVMGDHLSDFDVFKK